MFTTRSEVIVDRPIDEVYRFLADATNDPRWCPPVQEVTLIDEDGGTRRYRAVVRPGPRRLTSTFDLVQDEPPRRIAFQGSNEMADFHGHYTLASDGTGTRVEIVSTLDVHGLWRILSPIMKRMSQTNADEQARLLAQALDSAP